MVSGSPDVSNSFVSPYSNSMVSGSPDVSNSCVSQSGWWCLAFRMSPIHLLPLIATHLSPCLWCPAPGCLQFICLTVWLAVSGSPDVSNSFVSRYSNSFAGGVRLSGCLQFICLPLAIHLSRGLALHFICFPL